MIALIFVVLLGIAGLFFGKFIRKYRFILYIVMTVLSIVSFVFQDITITTPIMQGFLGLSLFYIVMLTGALKSKSRLRNQWVGVRREYSILGFIAIAPHALKYTLQWLTGERTFVIFGSIAFFLMIPLFITSFVSIRKKMKAKTWNLIQSAAYLIYLALFIHLILNYTKIINLVLYLVLFVTYIVMKTIYEVKKTRK
jgi:DMSO/TMAO reductase YedYZ heme-binding membrane subunit